MEQNRKITPSVWGEPMWRTIHVVSMGLPPGAADQVKQSYVNFYESLRTVIPCVTCAQGYSDIVSKTKPSIKDAVAAGPDALFSWTVDVHNAVAAKLGQPHMSEDYVRDHYIFGDPPQEERPLGDNGQPPWSNAVFQRHARNPIMVCLAAVATALLISLVLWYAVHVGKKKRRSR